LTLSDVLRRRRRRRPHAAPKKDSARRLRLSRGAETIRLPDRAATQARAGANGWMGGRRGRRVSGGGNARAEPRTHNLPIGTLHYSCLQLQSANQPDALIPPLRRHASSPLPSAKPHARIPSLHTVTVEPPTLLRARTLLFAPVKFSGSPRGGFELTINFGRARRPSRSRGGSRLSAIASFADGTAED